MAHTSLLCVSLIINTTLKIICILSYLKPDPTRLHQTSPTVLPINEMTSHQL